MAKRDTVKYQIKDGNEIVYYGITNDLERREQEHRSEGMDFTSIQKIGLLPLVTLLAFGKKSA